MPHKSNLPVYVLKPKELWLQTDNVFAKWLHGAPFIDTTIEF